MKTCLQAGHIVSKTYMTRVEGENSRFRHYLARLQCLTARYANVKLFVILSLRKCLEFLFD